MEREPSHFILSYVACTFGVILYETQFQHHFAQVAINGHNHCTWRGMARSHFVNATIQQLIL